MHPLAVDRLAVLALGSKGRCVPAILRVASGCVFIGFGLGKFRHHERELASFDSYGLPFPSEFVYAIGVTELVFGTLLVLGLGTRLAALALAGDMLGAIVTAGRVEGGAINLGLAPALLVAMVILLWTGPGIWSLDSWLVRRLERPGRR
jgi:putative oxidoreductase